MDYLYHYRIPFVLIATKADKIGKTQIKPRLKDIATDLKVGIGDITHSSAEKGVGKQEIFSLIEKAISVSNSEEENQGRRRYEIRA